MLEKLGAEAFANATITIQGDFIDIEPNNEFTDEMLIPAASAQWGGIGFRRNREPRSLTKTESIEALLRWRQSGGTPRAATDDPPRNEVHGTARRTTR